MPHRDREYNCDYNRGCERDCDCDIKCYKKLKACEFWAEKADIEKLCAEKLDAKEACLGSCVSDSLDAQNICVNQLGASNACIQDLNAARGSVQSLTVNDLCVANSLRANNFLNCGKYRAAATYSANVVYNLGSDINFDTVLDDPNSNLQVAPTRYTVPVSGYYMASFKYDVSNLISASGPLLGSPIGNPQILVNGVVINDMYTAWLTFANRQKLILSTLMRLKPGDIITLRYNILALDSTGAINVAGTVDVAGTGLQDGNSNFQISFLNADCTDMPCEPSLPCQPCTPRKCSPCEPCEPCDGLKAPYLNPIVVSPAGSNNYMVSWNHVKDANAYVLEQDTHANFSAPLIVSQGNVLSKSFMNQAPGTYYYRVFASSSKDNSPYSNVQSVSLGVAPQPPVAPVLNPISTDPLGSNNYMVSWNAVASALSYTLYQSSDPGLANPVVVAQGNMLSQSFVNQPNGSYFYGVLASNAAGNSPMSNIQGIVINVPLARQAASAPANMRARPGR